MRTETTHIDGTWSRRITIDGYPALELRDPNSGQDWDPATKPRHQYLEIGGCLWARRLPPESVGDTWEPPCGGWSDAHPDDAQWAPSSAWQRPAGAIAEYLEERRAAELAAIDGPAAQIDVLALVRARVGRRHRVSRDEAAALLVALAEAGVSLAGGSPETCHPSPARAAAAWVAICRDTTTVSAFAGGLRYDEPGSMHPLQYAPLLLCPSELADRTDHDLLTYLRRHAARVLVVTGV